MRVGIIGLGDIAQKAYLPVISLMPELQPVLCTRNAATMKMLSGKYRISECTSSVDDLIRHNIEAAFVHSATEVHPEIVEKLLRNGISVYVDKPMAKTYEEAASLVDLSLESGKILFTGFNRRFAPMYKNLRQQGEPEIVIMQKNRSYEPGDPRNFVFDDFIHVVDTLRFFMNAPIDDMKISASLKAGKLHHVVLQLHGGSCTAIGIMNRDAGLTEEVVEYMTSGRKFIVDNLVTTKHYADGQEHVKKFKDWDNTLYKRGFPQIINHFIDCVRSNSQPEPSAMDSLITHEICEKLVRALQQ